MPNPWSRGRNAGNHLIDDENGQSNNTVSPGVRHTEALRRTLSPGRRSRKRVSSQHGAFPVLDEGGGAVPGVLGGGGPLFWATQSGGEIRIAPGRSTPPHAAPALSGRSGP